MRDDEFDALVRKHRRAVFLYARSIARDHASAEDAVGETFLRAWKYQDSFRGSGSFEGWLLRICRNCVIDQARRHRDVVSLDAMSTNAVTTNAMNVSVAVLPDASVELTAMIDELPTVQREALVLCTVLGLDYQEAADLIGVPIGTVRSRVHRGRAALASMLNAAA